MSYREELEEIRDRVLHHVRLRPDLCPKPWQYAKTPKKELYLFCQPRISYHFWTTSQQVKLVLGTQLGPTKAEAEARKEAVTNRLCENEARIREALGEDVEFRWGHPSGQVISEKAEWPGATVGQIVERLTLYITTIQPIVHDL